MTPYEHDKVMAIVLGLSHFIAIVSADTLLSFDTFRQTRFIGGITYKMLLTLVESVISEAPELYASLQMSLPNMAEIEKLFQRKVKTWLNLVRNKDRQKFIERMDSLKAKIKERDPDFGKAYENVYKLVANL
jgi:prephenate dehydrogenase